MMPSIVGLPASEPTSGMHMFFVGSAAALSVAKTMSRRTVKRRMRDLLWFRGFSSGRAALRALDGRESRRHFRLLAGTDVDGVRVLPFDPFQILSRERPLPMGERTTVRGHVAEVAGALA